ncbi:hypothetical protein [Microtetraspora sp. NBRC 16547]|uniref:hypothetical protein n=1 Tax=Microtetraspora sp. NBRC 16547 TaxID=3030993 RepID=UPI0024A4E33B|nr:hypothetical protein [Microtetraspora sp. NBRC 16547]GLW96157.1 hypothetical protein Misp02_02440 [Microtetraspora sp. NBRC 16547]
MREPGGIEVSHADLRAGGDGLLRVGEDMALEVEVFATELAGRLDPWGDDELGSMCGPIYAMIRREAIDAYVTLAGGIRDAGITVETMSGNHGRAELAGAEAAANAVPGRMV